ncbi:hypothetical protein [Acetobacterium woodii]|uniref:hypothetical protein n=1 Tax=Acetobacterium woodii TaxID=33952 RepID=UPI0002FBBB11|nr:hypothetical protein [Acetobacterium woodii]
MEGVSWEEVAVQVVAAAVVVAVDLGAATEVVPAVDLVASAAVPEADFLAVARE